jgi:multiple sugar transport system substrate-binding protein
MKLRSRTLRFAAVATAALLGLTGCAISSNPSDNASSGGKVTLTFWEYYGGTQLTWLQGQVAKFEKANPKVDIKLVQTVGSQHDQKLLASVATGTTPDLFINNIVVDFPTLVGGGVMKDLTPYWNSYADKDQFPTAAVWKNNGKVYNLMFYTNLLGMFYNKDILQQYGITTPPKTLDEMQADMAKVKAGGKYKGVALSGAPTVEGAWLFAPQLLGEGINYCNFTGPQITPAFQRVATWSKNGYLPISAATWDQNAAWQQFSTGKFAFGINGNWQLGNVKTAKFKYGTTQFPAPPGGKSQVYPGGEGYAIGAKSKHADIAWKFLQQMVFSKAGGEGIYKVAGSIPMRADVADSPVIKADQYVQPFVTAAHDTAQWPNNKNTANMQTALGKAVSAVISGQKNPQQGAESAIQSIADAEKAGGGTCK